MLTIVHACAHARGESDLHGNGSASGAVQFTHLRGSFSFGVLIGQPYPSRSSSLSPSHSLSLSHTLSPFSHESSFYTPRSRMR